MNIVLAHNYYQYPGGEDQVFAAERLLLESHGHSVHLYTVHNDAVAQLKKPALARATVWNPESYRDVRALLQRTQADILHVHNTLPLISPAIYYAARAEGAAVVQTLHNYRLLCPAATFLRDGKICEACLGKTLPWPAVQHACYRDSRAASGAVATMLFAHRLRGTYEDMVDAYIALTEFARRKFIAGGLPAHKLHVKGNFVAPDPGTGDGAGGYALYAGRLSPEKGVEVLLAAWARLGGRFRLKIVGDGPLAEKVRQVANLDGSVEVLGRQPHDQVLRLMKEARVLVSPSTWYEGLPMSIIEAFAVGLPVIGSRLGAIPDILSGGMAGRCVTPDDSADLARLLGELLEPAADLSTMRSAARCEFEAKYTAERNYAELVDIYKRALQARGV
jgi:glycosyltransferase involved in cell wall biosynthesis